MCFLRNGDKLYSLESTLTSPLFSPYVYILSVPVLPNPHLPLWSVIPQSPPRYRPRLKSFSRNPQRPCRTFAKPWPWRRALDEYKNKDNDLGKGLIEERINEPWASITFFIQSTTRDCRPASTIFYFSFWARRSKYLSGLEPEYLDVKSVFVCPHSPPLQRPTGPLRQVTSRNREGIF